MLPLEVSWSACNTARSKIMMRGHFSCMINRVLRRSQRQNQSQVNSEDMRKLEIGPAIGYLHCLIKTSQNPLHLHLWQYVKLSQIVHNSHIQGDKVD